VPIDISLLDRDIEIIRAKHGPEAIRKASDMLSTERIPMPQFPTLMRATSARGVGGIPIGCVTRIYGTPSAGKTQLSYWAILNAQRYRSDRFPNGLKCCYWNIEGQFDKDYAASIGIDINELIIRDTDIIENIAEEMEILLASCHLHVLDSASHATSIEQLAIPASEWRTQRGVHAAAWKAAINRIHHRMDFDENVLIIIDHVNVNMQGYSEPMSGARMAYRSDLSIEMSKGAWLYLDDRGVLINNDQLKAKSPNGIGAAGMKEADGNEVTMSVPKSRICRPFRKGKMRLNLKKMRFETAFEFAYYGEFYDLDGSESYRSGKPPIISKHGTWYWCPRYITDQRRKDQGWSWNEKDVEKCQGGSGLRHYITATPELQQLILDSIQKDPDEAPAT
jgi:RecA/RadA recombinase